MSIPVRSFRYSPARCPAGTVAGRAEIELAGICLRVGDELLQRGGGYGGVDGEDGAGCADIADRLEVAERFVAGPHQVRRDREIAGRGIEQRVAVRLRLGDELGADRSAAARLVVDDDRLAELFAQLAGNDAAGIVVGGARREGNDVRRRGVQDRPRHAVEMAAPSRRLRWRRRRESGAVLSCCPSYSTPTLVNSQCSGIAGGHCEPSVAVRAGLLHRIFASMILRRGDCRIVSFVCDGRLISRAA